MLIFLIFRRRCYAKLIDEWYKDLAGVDRCRSIFQTSGLPDYYNNPIKLVEQHLRPISLEMLGKIPVQKPSASSLRAIRRHHDDNPKFDNADEELDEENSPTAGPSSGKKQRRNSNVHSDIQFPLEDGPDQNASSSAMDVDISMPSPSIVTFRPGICRKLFDPTDQASAINQVFLIRRYGASDYWPSLIVEMGRRMGKITTQRTAYSAAVVSAWNKNLESIRVFYN